MFVRIFGDRMPYRMSRENSWPMMLDERENRQAGCVEGCVGGRVIECCIVYACFDESIRGEEIGLQGANDRARGVVDTYPIDKGESPNSDERSKEMYRDDDT